METTANQDDGNEIKFLNTTGWIDHGNSSEKRSNRLTIWTKRGQGSVTADEPPRLMVRWRDNANDSFSNFQNVDLGRVGDSVSIARIDNLGTYRKRQWEFSMTDNVPFVLVDVEENVDQLVD